MAQLSKEKMEQQKYQWFYVVSGTKHPKLRYHLCLGTIEVAVFYDVENALDKQRKISNGKNFKNDMNDFLIDSKRAIEAEWERKQYHRKIIRISPADYKRFLKGK
jgi:hypothetical protein